MKSVFYLLALVIIVWSCLACGHSSKSDVTTYSNDNRTEKEQSICYSSSIQNKPTSPPVVTKRVTKRALVIGLGEQKDKNWAKINGDKDVPYVKKMLQRAGYTDLRLLVNKQATKDGVVSAFKSLASSCSAGDIVYIHFSGHGQQVTDVNGDEEDGLDESWIPYDAYLKYGDNDKGEKHLIDDEINTLLSAIRNEIGKSGKLLVVVDACHSGDSSRGEDLDETVRGVNDEFLIPVVKNTYSKKAPELWLTLSACKDFQLNQELKSPQVGKLTYILYTLSNGESLSMKKIEDLMAKYRSRLPQSPVLTGDLKTQKITDFF